MATMLITKVPTTTTAPRPTHLESSSCSGHIIDNASDNDADDYASFLSSLWQNAFLCYPQKQEDRIRSILRAGRSQTTTRGTTTTTITANLTSAAFAAQKTGAVQQTAAREPVSPEGATHECQICTRGPGNYVART